MREAMAAVAMAVMAVVSAADSCKDVRILDVCRFWAFGLRCSSTLRIHVRSSSAWRRRPPPPGACLGHPFPPCRAVPSLPVRPAAGGELGPPPSKLPPSSSWARVRCRFVRGRALC